MNCRCVLIAVRDGEDIGPATAFSGGEQGMRRHCFRGCLDLRHRRRVLPVCISLARRQAERCVSNTWRVSAGVQLGCCSGSTAPLVTRPEPVLPARAAPVDDRHTLCSTSLRRSSAVLLRPASGAKISCCINGCPKKAVRVNQPRRLYVTVFVRLSDAIC